MKHIQYCGLAMLLAGVWGTTLTTSAAETYLGAEAVLQKIKAKQGAPPEPEKKADPGVALRKQIAEFGTKVRTMAPEAAAKEWLGYFDQLGKMKPQNNGRPNLKELPASLNDLLEALPPPAAWPALEKAVQARPAAKGKELNREQGLKLLVYTLNKNSQARQALIGELEKQAKEADSSESYAYQSIFQELRNAMLASIDDPKIIMQMLEQQVAEGQGEYGREDIEVPNLVAIVGEKEAEAFLRRALVKPKIKLNVTSGTATQKLAQKLALELIKDLKTAQWKLVDSLEAVDLYEAMEKKFATKEEAAVATPVIPNLPTITRNRGFGADYEQQQAKLYYLLGLIAKQRTADAVKVAKEIGKEQSAYLPPDAIAAMEKAGYSRPLADFFYALLKENPGLPFWANYVQISANVGQTDKMLELARESAARKDLDPKKHKYVASMLVSALLAADKVDEGVAQLRQLTTSKDKDEAEDDDENPYSMVESGSAGVKLARIGHLMQKPEWIEEGLKMARKSLVDGGAVQSRYGSRDGELELAALLLELNRGIEAEQLVLDYLAKQPVTTNPRNNYMGVNVSRQALHLLTAIYHQAGRSADVLTIFNDASGWQAKDAKDIYLESSDGNSYSHYHKRQQPAGFLLAHALIKANRAAEARPIINALLDQMPGIDRGYELLLMVDAANAGAKLDELYARDQFEERPLIWKGKLLLDAGQLDEAEKVIRKAVAVDPSDGEQGPDDRMRVYTILADIRDRKGDKKEAELFRGAVKAIRLSEQADKFAQAGLLKRAVQMYQDSLKHFADAYCIQSRLAIQLSEMGMHKEAEAYYQKAYELMPDSFGRVESHCFGCERAFSGDRAQGIAERVFTKLVTERPDKPQVHYLLGYLRHEQERHDDALPLFRKAVQLDPDYLNAWVKLQETMEHVRLPLAERDRVTLQILRLDPLFHHARTSFRDLADLAGLWEQIDKAQALKQKPPGALYELAASKKAMEAKAKNVSDEENLYNRMSYLENQNRQLTPARALQGVTFIQASVQLMGGRGGSAWFD